MRWNQIIEDCGIDKSHDTIKVTAMNTLFEMAGLRQARTGLPLYVWVSPRAGNKHDVRIKVSSSHKYDPENEVVVGIRPDFHYVHGMLNGNNDRLLRQWVVLNFDTIVAFWNEEIDTEDMLDRIQRL